MIWTCHLGIYSLLLMWIALQSSCYEFQYVSLAGKATVPDACSCSCPMISPRQAGQ